jgi:uncharacterized protein (TIGR03437 family)
LSSSKTVRIDVNPIKAAVFGIYNSASLERDQTCSPGSIATLMGSDFTTSDAQPAGQTPLPTELGGVRVKVNGTAAPLLAVTSQLINFQCPTLAPGTPLTITVESASADSADPIETAMAETTPGIFKMNAGNQGTIMIAGTNQLAMPSTDAMASRAAKTGEYVSIFANGLGPVAESVTAGTPAPVDHTISTLDRVTVVIGDLEVVPSFAGLAPGLAGLYQVNVAIPSTVSIGDSVPVYIKVTRADGTVAVSNSVTAATQRSDQ